jgi:hypothetical protein
MAVMKYSSGGSGGGTVSLNFPSTAAATHDRSIFTSLQDDKSSLLGVARVSLALSQYAACGCPSTSESFVPENGPLEEYFGEQVNCVIRQTCLFNEASVTKEVANAIKELIICAREHTHSRCRALAVTCLAQLARASYARCREDPCHASTSRAPPSSSQAILEDECAVEVPTVLAEIALSDPNDLVSAHAFEALATLCLDAGKDPLMHSTHQVSGSVRSTSYFHSDYMGMPQSVVMTEYSSRIVDHVLSNRLRGLTNRATKLTPSTNQVKALPIITFVMCQLHSNTTQPSNLIHGTLLPARYGKRWYEVDLGRLVDDFASVTLMRNLRDSPNGTLALSCATSLICLACSHGSHPRFWVREGCLAAVDFLMKSLESERGHLLKGNPKVPELRANKISLILIAARSVQRDERVNVMIRALTEISYLPGREFNGDNQTPSSQTSYRVALLSDLFTSFLSLDQSMTEVLERTLSSDEVQFHLDECGSRLTTRGMCSFDEVPSFGYELVVIFCDCSAYFGNRLSSRQLPRKEAAIPWHQQQVNDWLQQSLLLLEVFAVSWSWNAHAASLSKADKICLESVSESYLSLLGQCLDSVGLLRSSAEFLDQEKRKNDAREQIPESIRSTARQLTTLVSSFLIHKIPEGIASESARIGLLGIMASHWVAKCSSNALGLGASERRSRSDITEALQLVRMLGSDLQLCLRASLINCYEDDLLPTCLTSVELIATIAAEQMFKCPFAHLKENYAEIVSMSLDSLTTRLDRLRSGNLQSRTSIDALMKCSVAARRIESIFDGGAGAKVNSEPLSQGSIPSWIIAAEENEIDDESVISSISSHRPSQKRSMASHLGQPFLRRQQNAAKVLSLTETERHLYWKVVQQMVAAKIDAGLICSDLLVENVAYGVRRWTTGELGREAKQCYTGAANEYPTLRVNPGRWYYVSSLSKLGARRTPSNNMAESSLEEVAVPLTGTSDPIMATFSAKVVLRPSIDGRIKKAWRFLLRTHNAVAAPISQGLKFEIVVSKSNSHEFYGAEKSALSSRLRNVLLEKTGTTESLVDVHPIATCSATLMEEFSSNEVVNWELEMTDSPFFNLVARPSISFPKVKIEGIQRTIRWAYGDPAMTTKNGNVDDGQSEESDTESISEHGQDEESFDLSLSCMPVHIPSLLHLEPCPLVLFRKNEKHMFEGGDMQRFNLLWRNLKYSTGRISLLCTSQDSSDAHFGGFARSQLRKGCVNIREDLSKKMYSECDKAWAFVTLNGKRLFCVLNVARSGNPANTQAAVAFIEIRSDDPSSLAHLACRKASRNQFVGALTTDWMVSDVDLEASDDLVTL